MEKLPTFYIKILQILSSRYGLSCTLEELTSLLSPVLNSSMIITDNISTEKQNQAIVLDALIHLNDQGLLFLNSNADKSSISIMGLIKVNSKIICN